MPIDIEAVLGNPTNVLGDALLVPVARGPQEVGLAIRQLKARFGTAFLENVPSDHWAGDAFLIHDSLASREHLKVIVLVIDDHRELSLRVLIDCGLDELVQRDEPEQQKFPQVRHVVIAPLQTRYQDPDGYGVIEGTAQALVKICKTLKRRLPEVEKITAVFDPMSLSSIPRGDILGRFNWALAEDIT